MCLCLCVCVCVHSQIGEVTRPLTMASIEEFCRDFGLDPEFSMHSNIRGLSGGQKVRQDCLNVDSMHVKQELYRNPVYQVLCWWLKHVLQSCCVVSDWPGVP